VTFILKSPAFSLSSTEIISYLASFKRNGTRESSWEEKLGWLGGHRLGRSAALLDYLSGLSHVRFDRAVAFGTGACRRWPSIGHYTLITIG
jgi:hypothetical protein